MSNANGKTAKGFAMLKKMVEPETEDAEIVDEVNSEVKDAEQSEADTAHEKEIVYNLLMNTLLSECNKSAQAGGTPDVLIAALISAAGNVADQTIKDTDALRNYMGHCYASTLAALEAHRGLGQGEMIQDGNDAGGEGKETH